MSDYKWSDGLHVPITTKWFDEKMADDVARWQRESREWREKFRAAQALRPPPTPFVPVKHTGLIGAVQNLKIGVKK